MSEEELAGMFSFLDQLRKLGNTNMWGARPYLQEEFPMLSDSAARSVVLAWMKTFERGIAPEDRAKSANAQGFAP